MLIPPQTALQVLELFSDTEVWRNNQAVIVESIKRERYPGWYQKDSRVLIQDFKSTPGIAFVLPGK
jgi:hypothetical protein